MKFDETTIKEAFNNVPSGVQELLSSEEITNDIVAIGEKYSLNEDDLDPLIVEVGYMLLGLKEKKENYSDFISENIHSECPEGFTNEINKYVNSIHDKAARFIPLETESGDKVVWSTEHKDFYITKDFFFAEFEGKFPHSYVRSIDLIHTSGFQEIGFFQSIFFIVFGLLIGIASLSGIFSFTALGVILGGLGILLSYWLIKQPFTKSRPRVLIQFHPNLNQDMIILDMFSEEDAKDAVKILKKYH